MVKTRSMRNRNPTKTVRRIYRRRIKNSRCRRFGSGRPHTKKIYISYI